MAQAQEVEPGRLGLDRAVGIESGGFMVDVVVYEPKQSCCCLTQAVSGLPTDTRWGKIAITRGPVSRAADAIGGHKGTSLGPATARGTEIVHFTAEQVV